MESMVLLFILLLFIARLPGPMRRDAVVMLCRLSSASADARMVLLIFDLSWISNVYDNNIYTALISLLQL